MKQSITGPFHGLAALSALLLVVAAHREAVGQGNAGAARPGRAGLVIEGGRKVRRIGGAVVSSINVENRPLKEVMIYLSQRSGYNIIPQNERTGDILVSLDLRNVHWETVLNVLAAKYKLIINRRDMARHRIIVVNSPERISYDFRDATLSKVIQMIADLGRANVIMGQAVFSSPLKDTKISFKFNDVPWRTALEIVLKTNKLVLVEEDFGVLRVASPEELEEQLETRIFSLGYLTPSGSKYTAVITSPYIEKEIKGAGGEDLFRQSTLIHVVLKVISDKGKVVFEKRTNSLVVTDSPAKLDVIQRLVETLDVPPKQVHLSLRLIELNDDDIERVGMDWEGAAGRGLTFNAKGSTFSSMFPFGGNPPGYGSFIVPEIYPQKFDSLTGAPLGRFNRPAQGSFSPGTLDFSQLQAVLHLIRTQTRGRVIQAPQLIVLDNEEATIQIGELIRYAESSVQVTPAGSASSFREADRSPVNLGIQMLVIPHVTGPDNNIILTVIPKTEDFTSADVTKRFLEFSSPLGTLLLPQTTQRIVVTKMMLRNGETGVIAGLRKEIEGVTIKKVPFLGDIPILGWLFRFRSQTRSTQDLLIFITPQVIDLREEDALSRRFLAIEESMGGAFGREEGTRRLSAEDFQ